MKTFPFKKIDAFATGDSTGNPAGAVYLDAPEDITPDEMQRLALELKGFVSEVGFLYPLEGGRFGLRYYSSEREVAFCGHATIAILYDLIQNRPDLIAKDSVCVQTNRGVLRAHNRIREEDAIFIEAPRPVFRSAAIPMSDISESLGTGSEGLRADLPAAIVNAGLETLIVPAAGLDAILSLAPDIERLKAFCLLHSIDIITVYSEETSLPGSGFRTRVFAPTFGYLEDPATGSGNSAFGFYLMKHLGWNAEALTIEQNGSAAHPNIVKLRFQPDQEGAGMVLFGGSGAVRISGEYRLI